METGFIKLYRKMVDWQWYSDTNVFRIFTHLLLTANYKDKYWQNIVIKRGQKVTSLNNLCEETGLTIRQTRVALDKLKESKELTIKTTNKYSLITIDNYSKYQDIPEQIVKQIDKQMTDKCQTNDTQDDKRMTTTKEYKEIKNSKNINNIPKTKYGEYKHVLLTEKELQSLKSSYQNYEDLIKYLDEYIEMKGYKAKNHYLCIKKWVVEAVQRTSKTNSKEIEDWLNE